MVSSKVEEDIYTADVVQAIKEGSHNNAVDVQDSQVSNTAELDFYNAAIDQDLPPKNLLEKLEGHKVENF